MSTLRSFIGSIEHARVIAKLRRALHDDRVFVLIVVQPLPGPVDPGTVDGYELRNTMLDLLTNADSVTLSSVLTGVLEEETKATAPTPVPQLKGKR